MTDPQPAPGRRTPPRAEPLQPDAPAKGDDVQSGDDDDDVASHDDLDDVDDEQADNALRNVREGYGKS